MAAPDNSRRRPGRPAGSSDTRERILSSARELFAHNGIDRTSIRAVAAKAGVDAALVHHYFGTKQQLFAAAIHSDRPDGHHRSDSRGACRGTRLQAAVLVAADLGFELGAGLIATLRSLISGSDVGLALLP